MQKKETSRFIKDLEIKFEGEVIRKFHKNHTNIINVSTIQ